MPAYALAHLYDPKPHPEVIEYIERVQATLDPYGGRFVAHGPQVEVAEGEWPGTIVIVEFPSLEEALAWYASPAYQEILPLRTRNIRGTAIIFDGVGPEYDAAGKAAEMRALLAAIDQQAEATPGAA